MLILALLLELKSAAAAAAAAAEPSLMGVAAAKGEEKVFEGRT